MQGCYKTDSKQPAGYTQVDAHSKPFAGSAQGSTGLREMSESDVV